MKPHNVPPDPSGTETCYEQPIVSPRDSDHVVLVVWDQCSHATEIEVVTERCGAQQLRIDGSASLGDLRPSSRCHIALVGFRGQDAAKADDLAAMCLLKRKGFRVISFGDGVQFWPLKLRCEALLAGASQLLDSADQSFVPNLQAWITRLLQAESAKRDAEEQAKAVMNRLGIVGESAPITSVFQRLQRVSALSDLPVLLVGETGTGKELFAHALHRLDPKRSQGPFVTLNCGALSVGLAESELFGHRRGSFTGAERSRKGVVRSADGGFLFLDEIGELDSSAQVKLLRVLQENRVLPVGEDEEVPVSVRVIAATNRKLDEMVQARSFREDLFHRLNVVAVSIPPLRERPDDLKPLVEHFLQKHQSLVDGNKLQVHEDFVNALTQLSLPGNVRQLENVVRQVLVSKADDTPLTLSDLPQEFWRQLAVEEQEHNNPVQENAAGDIPPSVGSMKRNPSAVPWNAGDLKLSSSLQRFERMTIESALLKSGGNQAEAARMLGITPRSVYNKLRKHNLQA